MRRLLVSTESGNINLQETDLKSEWETFVIVMFVMWSVVFLGSSYVVVRDFFEREEKAKHITNRKPGRLLRFVVMSLNIFIALARLCFYVDPRGWNNIYPSIIFEMLLRVPFCLQLAEWLLIILRWRDLKMFTGSSGMFLMLKWTPQRWTHITVAVIGGLSLTVIVLTLVAESGVSTEHLTDAVNMVLGIYAGVFIVSGLYVGFAAIRAMARSWPARRKTSSGSATFGRTGESHHLTRAYQILISLMFATPMAVIFIAVSMWRGMSSLSPKAFFAYLVIRHTTEVVLCLTATYAIKNSPNLSEVSETVRSISMPILRSSFRMSQRLKEFGRQQSTTDPQVEPMKRGPSTEGGPAPVPANSQRLLQLPAQGFPDPTPAV